MMKKNYQYERGRIKTHRNPRNTKEFLVVDVLILEKKVLYGQPRYLVKPVSGRGRVWVVNLELYD